MATKLQIFNRALYHLGERKLSSLTEASEPRRALDDHYVSGIDFCLEAALWNFAIRAIEIEATGSVSPTFGFTFAFQKPDDWVRTASLSDNERFDPPLNDYRDEAGYWWADSDPLYVTYVSNDEDYGYNLAMWPESFTEYVTVHLARMICKRITNSTVDEAELKKEERNCRASAISKDALNEGAKFRPLGTWVRSRWAGANRPFRRANSIIG